MGVTRTGVWMGLLVAASVSLGAIGCNSTQKVNDAGTKPAAQPKAQAEEQRFDLKGKVVAVDKAGKKVTVDHEAIPGFMGAMTMMYPVKDEHALDGIAVGDQVTAKVVSRGGPDYWLEDVRAAK
jgi:protein SCO1/2